MNRIFSFALAFVLLLAGADLASAGEEIPGLPVVQVTFSEAISTENDLRRLDMAVNNFTKRPEINYISRTVLHLDKNMVAIIVVHQVKPEQK